VRSSSPSSPSFPVPPFQLPVLPKMCNILIHPVSK
jgi:hypothetical protein